MGTGTPRTSTQPMVRPVGGMEGGVSIWGFVRLTEEQGDLLGVTLAANDTSLDHFVATEVCEWRIRGASKIWRRKAGGQGASSGRGGQK